MKPAVGDLEDQSNLIHGKLYYIKFYNSDNYNLAFYDKHKSYESTLPFVFITEPDDIDYDSYDVYAVMPEDYMTNAIKNVKTRKVTHFPATMGSQIQSPQIGAVYYFFGHGDLRPTKGKLVDMKEVHTRRGSSEVYVVATADDTEHFPIESTGVYEFISRNNLLKNAKTQRKMIRNKGVNRTIRNIVHVATNPNSIHNNRKALLKFYQNAWNKTDTT